MATIAEPMRSLAATSSDMTVDVTIPGAVSISCDVAVSLGNLSAGTTAGDSSSKSRCIVITNEPLGYTLKWQMTTGSGGYGTGHLNSYVKNPSSPGGNGGYQIRALMPSVGGTPETFTSVSAADVRWAGRLRSESTTTLGAAMPDFGTDSSTEKFLNVGTGSAVSITKRTSATSINGDDEYIQFKAIAGSSNVNAASVYKGTVIVSIVNN
jgi:hypothetical protein